METVTDFIFLGSKITVDNNCSHEIKRHLLLGRKAMTNLDSVLKRDITLPTKIHIVKAIVFPVVMYGYECWTVKKKKKYWVPKNWFLWAVVLEKTSGSPLVGKEIKPVNAKGNQPLIFIGRTDAEAGAQSFGHLMWRANSLGKKPWGWERLKAVGEGDDWEQDSWMASPTWWTWVWANFGK